MSINERRMKHRACVVLVFGVQCWVEDTRYRTSCISIFNITTTSNPNSHLATRNTRIACKNIAHLQTMMVKLFFLFSQLLTIGAFNNIPCPTKNLARCIHHSSRPRGNKNLALASTNGNSKESFILKEFNQQEDLKEIVSLASQSLPERPDGIVTVAKYTSATRQNCVATEDQYERLARSNQATLFLRCYEEYEGASLLISSAQVSSFPTYDVFYAGNRVARIEGDDMNALESTLDNYQLLNSKLDLFSESADNQRRLDWGDGKIKGFDGSTPKTTAMFIPGYDWNTDGGAFDEAANKAQHDWDDMYGNWVPTVEEN